jgi:hypothetical protein
MYISSLMKTESDSQKLIRQGGRKERGEAEEGEEEEEDEEGDPHGKWSTY